MSTALPSLRGHLSVSCGPAVAGVRTIRLQVEDNNGPGLSCALLSPDQALRLAAELVERADYDVTAPDRKPISSGDGDSAFYRAQEALER